MFDKSLIEKLNQRFRCHLYAKGQKGAYLYCNDHMLEDIGLHHKNEILGLTDFDLHFLEVDEAKNLRANDTMVMTTAKSNIIIEQVTLANMQKSIAISYKEPFYEGQKIIGIRGASIIVDKNEFASQPFFLINQLIGEHASFSLNALTSRERECFNYLTRGFTAKQIGKKIQLSARTVENYIEKIKIKLDCASKAELIEKASSFIMI